MLLLFLKNHLSPFRHYRRKFSFYRFIRSKEKAGIEHRVFQFASNIRPDRLATIDRRLISKKIIDG